VATHASYGSGHLVGEMIASGDDCVVNHPAYTGSKPEYQEASMRTGRAIPAKREIDVLLFQVECANTRREDQGEQDGPVSNMTPHDRTWLGLGDFVIFPWLFPRLEKLAFPPFVLTGA
jgi:hypothetical protein